MTEEIRNPHTLPNLSIAGQANKAPKNAAARYDEVKFALVEVWSAALIDVIPKVV